MRTLIAMMIAGLAFAASSGPAAAAPRRQAATIVLVHGAFAESASWNQVAQRLQGDGFHVVAAANPLRGVQADAQYVGALAASIAGPVVLVGHSYAGSVISDPAAAPDNVRALVFVSAFAPDAGETALALTARFPGSSLGAALAAPVPLPDGSHDLYVDQQRFPGQFAADVPPRDAALMAATQRPVRDAALAEPSREPTWKRLPSRFIYGSADRNIPAAAMAFMAARAGARSTTVIPGASHVVMISHSGEVVATIEAAARD